MFSTSCKNAIRAVLFLAINSDETNKFGVDDLANALDVSRHFLAKTLQLLAKNGLISSTRGPKGGFYLSSQNRKNNLLDVIEFIDGPEANRMCVLGLQNCSNDNPCPFHAHVKKFRSSLDQFLQDQTIEEAAQQVSLADFRF